jgi:hypothetical protein
LSKRQAAEPRLQLRGAEQPAASTNFAVMAQGLLTSARSSLALSPPKTRFSAGSERHLLSRHRTVRRRPSGYRSGCSI